MRETAIGSHGMEDWTAREGAVLRSIFDQAGFGLALLDRDLRFVLVNEPLAEINGVPAARHIGKTVAEILPAFPDDGEAAQATRRVFERGETVLGVEVTGPHNDEFGARTFECSYHPVLEGGEVVGMWSSVREVTSERRTAVIEERLSDQLLEERRVLEEVFARAPGAMALLWGPDMRIRAFNRQLLESAPDRGRLYDRPIAEVFPEVAELTRGTAARVLERGETVRYTELELPWGGEGAIDGMRYYSFSVTPVTGSDETGPAGALVVGQDVTELVRRRLDLESELESEHRIVTELQVSLRPDRLPEVPGADIASVFRPAGDGYEIGGDFFDVFPLDERCWMVVMGDVCGKGAEAASLTALARYTLRAAAIQEGAKPATLLERLNEAVRRQRADLRFLTCVCAFVWPQNDGSLEALACVAGHPPPFKVGDGGEVTAVGLGGGLVGAWDSPDFAEESFALQKGEQLVLYTDGVTEAGAPRSELGEDGLVALLGEQSATGPAGTVAAIERAVSERTNGPPRDDVAVLVIGVKA